MKVFRMRGQRLNSQAGIAIGPILFIVAILGILAAAIAAGSGSFTSNTSSETARTKASALIQIGENLKIGMDRITMSGGYDPSAVIMNVRNTENANDLFSPSGGGIAPPSTAMALDPTNAANGSWYFIHGPMEGYGTSSDDYVAVLPVAQGVCTEINNRTTGKAIIPTSATLGDFTEETASVANLANWPNASSTIDLRGVSVGCVNNGGNYYFFQVLAIQ